MKKLKFNCEDLEWIIQEEYTGVTEKQIGKGSRQRQQRKAARILLPR